MVIIVSASNGGGAAAQAFVITTDELHRIAFWSHDLSESVRRHVGGRCEYVRVTSRGYQGFAGEE